MRSMPLAIAAFLLLPLAGAMAAGKTGYDVQPIKSEGKFIGCMAMNEDTGLTFVGTAETFSVMMTAKDFKVAKGDPVSGTWTIDGGKERALGIKADGPSTVSADFEATMANIKPFMDGTEVTVALGKNTIEFDLSGSMSAMNELNACMDKGTAAK